VPVRCFPYPMTVAERALEIELGKTMEVVKTPGTGFCMDERTKPIAQAAQVLAD